ncbi:MAG: exopolyphosphatase [Bacteroidota bacterium]
MAAQRRAVIDLGTNTFHLLIADLHSDGRIEEVYRERRFVKLASEGIATIGAAPFTRGIESLNHYKKILKEYKCIDLKAIGTAALRTATNGPDFVRAARQTAGIDVQLIPGDEEARLITRGVIAALPPLTERVLIMDIGGGSTEFIIADRQTVFWRQSFPIGVSVLHNNFHAGDPIEPGAVTRLEAFLQETTAPLALALADHPTHHLIGAAGTFDVLAEVLRAPDAAAHPTSHRLTLRGLDELTDQIIGATLAERLAMPGVPEQRADMIVVAMILIRFVNRLARIERITVSDWAMKEGILLSL